MATLPTIETERLLLRPHQMSDAVELQRLLNDKAIADTTRNIPYPYFEAMALDWLSSREPKFLAGEAANFAITKRDSGELLGSVGFRIHRDDERAEMGYWIGRPYWNLGYCSEAAAAALDYGFTGLSLNRIHACYVTRNPASGRVLEKIGMRPEGLARQHEVKWGQYEDLAYCGVLREDWIASD